MSETNDPDQMEELRELIAQLTQRVFRLEQLLEGGASSSFGAAEPAYPTLQLDPEIAAAHKISAAPAQASTSPRIQIAPEPDGGLPPFGVEQEALPPQSSPASANARIPGTPLDLPRDQPAATEVVAFERPARRDMSLESRIGGQWLNRIGIIAVLVGISYFLKLAFDNNWIGAPVRVAIGVVLGIGLLFWSEPFRKRGYPAFAYSLKAIALGSLYLSIWAAFSFYSLIPAPVAFAAMVLVTVTAAALSFRQDSELLAAFALLGGFATPILVSTGENQELALFSYLALLDLGTLWMVSIKGWRRILLGSYLGTALLFTGWALSYYTETQMATTLAFASGFFLLYVLAPLAVRKPTPKEDSGSLIALALLNAAGYFAACYSMLSLSHRDALSGITLALALVCFGLCFPLERRAPGAQLLGQLYLALAVGFLTIAIPLKLDHHWMTLGWIVEGGALFYAAFRSRSSLLRGLGLISLVLGVTRLVGLESAVEEPFLVNPRFGLYLLAILAMALLAYFSSRQGGEGSREWAGGAILCVNLLALAALHFEISGYFQSRIAATPDPLELRRLETLYGFSYSALWMAYAGVLMLIGFLKRSAFLRWQAIVLLAATVGKVFLFDVSSLERGYRIAAFIVLGVILLAVSYFYQRSRVRAATEQKESTV